MLLNSVDWQNGAFVPSEDIPFCFTPSQRKAKQENNPLRSLLLCGQQKILKDPLGSSY